MTYITSFTGGLNGVPSNCAMTALCRLSAQYVTDREYPSVRARMLNLYGQAVANDPGRAILFRDGDSLRNTVSKIQQVSTAISGQSYFPFPLEYGFGKLLVDIMERNPAILFLSDVENGGSDGHIGEFHTGAFAEWALRTGVMTGHQTTGLKNRGERSYDIYAWNLVLDPGRANNVVSDLGRQASAYVADVLDGSKIQEAISEAEQARKNQQAVITSNFDNWLQATPIDQTIPPTPAPIAQGAVTENMQEGGTVDEFAPVPAPEDWWRAAVPPAHAEAMARAARSSRGRNVQRGDIFRAAAGRVRFMGGDPTEPINWQVEPTVGGGRAPTATRVRTPRPFPPMLRRR